MRACGGISKERNSIEPQPPGRAVGRIELVDADLGPVRVAGHVDQQVAEDAVDEPRRYAALRGVGDLLQRDFHLEERFVTRLVEARRLARRADEQAGEQVRERRMVLPIGDDRRQQVGAAQERAVGRRDAAHDDVIAAAGAGVASVGQILVGAEPRLFRLFVDGGGDGDHFLPVRRRMDVDLDDAGVGRDLDDVDARIVRRRIAFDVHRQLGGGGGFLDGGDERGEIQRVGERRQEHAQVSVARLDGERGAHRAVDLARTGRRRDGRRPQRHGLALLNEHRPLGQRRRLAERVARQNVRIIDVGKRGERSDRQAESGRRIARYQEELAAARAPTLGHPAAAEVGRLPHLHRKDVARRLVEAMLEDAHDARTLGGILQLVLFRRDVERQLLLDERVVAGILVGGNTAVGQAGRAACTARPSASRRPRWWLSQARSRCR